MIEGSKYIQHRLCSNMVLSGRDSDQFSPTSSTMCGVHASKLL